jgi:ABC-type nickel/cobalt efflux system permease component RcnA
VALGLGAYLLIARLGAWMEARRHAGAHDHAGEHAHDHDHGAPGHRHPHEPSAEGALSRKGLVALALAGGILPAPSALIVMLASIDAHRVVFGLALVLSFSAGLATALIAVGMGAMRARDVVARRLSTFWGRLVPVLSASAILGVGAFLSLRGLAKV